MPVHSGTIGTDGAAWRLYADGTLVVDEGFIYWRTTGIGVQAYSPWAVYRSDINRIVFTGPITAGTSLSGLFARLVHVTHIDGLDYFDTRAVEDLSDLFVDAWELHMLDLRAWDTANVTNMTRMFFHAWGLRVVDVTGWDVRNVAFMGSMFQSVPLDYLHGIEDWQTDSLLDTSAMFSRFGHGGERAFYALDLSNWDVSNVGSMWEMFHFARVTHLNLAGWDTRNVQSMHHMFLRDWNPLELRLQQFTLGEHFAFTPPFEAAAGHVFLLDPPNNANYTGRWQNVGAGTTNDPQGTHVFTSLQLMQFYNGQAGLADTWVWQPTDANRPQRFLRGDVNGDGYINLLDVLLILRMVAGHAPLPGTNLKAARVTPASLAPGGQVSMQDAMAVLRFIEQYPVDIVGETFTLN